MEQGARGLTNTVLAENEALYFNYRRTYDCYLVSLQFIYKKWSNDLFYRVKNDQWISKIGKVIDMRFVVQGNRVNKFVLVEWMEISNEDMMRLEWLT